MKKIKVFLLGLILVLSLAANAQVKSDKMFDTFSNKEGITNFTFTKNMTDAFNINLSDDNGKEKKLKGDLSQIRFMSYNPKKGNLGGSEFVKKAEALLPTQYVKYEEADKDSDADIYLLGNNRKFSEFLIFINNNNDNEMSFVISFQGNFTATDLDGLKQAGHSFSDED